METVKVIMQFIVDNGELVIGCAGVVAGCYAAWIRAERNAAQNVAQVTMAAIEAGGKNDDLTTAKEVVGIQKKKVAKWSDGKKREAKVINKILAKFDKLKEEK